MIIDFTPLERKQLLDVLKVICRDDDLFEKIVVESAGMDEEEFSVLVQKISGR